MNKISKIIIVIIILLLGVFIWNLVMSFNNFEELLPNKVDLNNGLRGDPTGSSVDKSNGLIKLYFRYTISKKNLIDLKNSSITTKLGKICNAIELKNLNSNKVVKINDVDKSIAFIPGQDGEMIFDCINSKQPVSKDLLKEKNFQGHVKINIYNSHFKDSIFSEGDILLNIK